ncbi:MAG: hypothetical protein Q8S02_02335 [Hydrogenophaga sp.]|nr:hypothetical protein [Hydrogenophaga sp.]
MRVFLIEATVAGTLGALAMMPAGFFFRALQMRVGHYGPKFAELYLSSPGPLALFMQHIVLGWVSAVPLAFLSLNKYSVRTAFLIGASYGALYYVAVNALLLPIYFGDVLPWTLGWPVVVPSLVVHIVFGIVVSLTGGYFRDRFARTGIYT